MDDAALRRSVDAQDWAKAFMSVFDGRSGDIDEGTMIGWFANYRFTVEEALTGSSAKAVEEFLARWEAEGE